MVAILQLVSATILVVAAAAILVQVARLIRLVECCRRRLSATPESRVSLEEGESDG